MYGLNEIMIFSSILFVVTIVNAENPVNSKIVFSAVATDKDVESLHSIKSEEVLPIILYEGENKQIVPNTFPMDLAQVDINNGRIRSSYETRFLTAQPQKAIFFCPHPDENEKCLVPEPFDESQALQCKREPTPTMRYPPQGNHKCGPISEGSVIRVDYDICPRESTYIYKNRNITIYSFCYDTLLKRNIFVHYRIQSPKLLSEKLLTREQELKFDQLSTETYGEITQILDYKKDLDAQVKLKPSYTLQKLASPKHMAFYTWKKTTNHFINVALQHEKLFNLWNKIQDYIAADAAAVFASIRNVTTGVIEIPSKELPTELDNSQMYNIWMTAVLDGSVEPTRAIAILMNNFIDTKQTDTSNVKQQYIDKLCPKEADKCVESLKAMFAEAGGQVRCCFPTEEITSLFNAKNPIEINRLLQIRNITTD